MCIDATVQARLGVTKEESEPICKRVIEAVWQHMLSTHIVDKTKLYAFRDETLDAEKRVSPITPK